MSVNGRSIWLLGGVICVAATVVAGAVLSKQSRHEFLGVYLGMSEKNALRHMSSLGEGASVGDLCAGNYGVGVYLKYMGYDWQFMAHTDKGRVHELKLYRFDSKGTESKAQCLQLYQSLTEERRSSAAPGSWTERLAGKNKGFNVSKQYAQSFPDGTKFQVTAQRLDWSHARCLVVLTMGVDKQSK